MSRLLSTILIIGALTGCHDAHYHASAKAGVNRPAGWVKVSDPRGDVADAIARKELRFWAIDDVAPIVPGVDQDGVDSRWVKTFGFRVIANGAGDIPLKRAAHKYARTYNQNLLRYLRAEAYDN